MSKPTRKIPVVTVLAAGSGLTVGAACHKDVVTSNPPPPTQGPSAEPGPTPPPVVEASPTDLPAWDDVASGHPKGATNPPIPLLVISADGEHCWKEWISPMRPGPDTMLAIKKGAKVLPEGELSTGTEIVCPETATGHLEDTKASEG